MNNCENCPNIERLACMITDQRSRMDQWIDRINIGSVDAQASTIIATERLKHMPESEEKDILEAVIELNNQIFKDVPSIVNKLENDGTVSPREEAEALAYRALQYCKSGPVQKRTLFGGLVLRCGSSIVDKKDGTKRLK